MADTSLLTEHLLLARRYFLLAGVVGPIGLRLVAPRLAVAAAGGRFKPAKAGAKGDPYFTPVGEFFDVSRGKPLPHSLPEEKKRAVGLTQETWSLDVVSDPERPARIGKPMTKVNGTALNFAGLVELGRQHAVRFPKVMTCLNLGCPLGMGLWEGVPLRTVLWKVEPRENLRRVFYYGYHNDDPAQMFRSSLPIGRVLEDPFDTPPVILCYKLNGQWLDSERGGPVRVVVPEAYGFKSIKWLTHVVLTNLAHANDTYAEQNNDVDSPLKTFAATLSAPLEVDKETKIPVSGYAQVGVSGLTKVQVAIEPASVDHAGDPYFLQAPWKDATLLDAPRSWGLDASLLPSAHGFDSNGRPKSWPMRLSNAHWAITLPGLPPGKYTLRSRTIDNAGQAQPMPRPFRKSGHAAIESLSLVVRS